MVGTNAPPRACVCEMESQCVCVGGWVGGWVCVCERERWSLSVCVLGGACVCVCVCRRVLCVGCNLSVHGFHHREVMCMAEATNDGVRERKCP